MQTIVQPVKAPHDSPVFLFSAGMRSGSTFLQRMITASGQVLIWGESGDALNHMADAYRNWHKKLYKDNGARFYQEFITVPYEDRPMVWSATMNPPLATIEENFLRFFDSVYGDLAHNLGYPRWGIKDVFSTLETAEFLKSIYPNAYFIFLVRNPIDSILSIKRRKWGGDIRLNNPSLYYARMWNNLAVSFKRADFGFLVRYEDLMNDPETIKKLFDYLNLEVPDIDLYASKKVDWESNSKKKLSWWEKIQIKFVLRDTMLLYKYL